MVIDQQEFTIDELNLTAVDLSNIVVSEKIVPYLYWNINQSLSGVLWACISVVIDQQEFTIDKLNLVAVDLP